ncbi:MAG TPA: transglutaminase-like domain-containing protein [Solirubrobacteraceae bacterium]|jgi:regulator of sirC expression with transglutaminase-like and TPR domain|nr:transglutaminase-like domain-containing protein [Solirubrobacteraceae bacterium]
MGLGSFAELAASREPRLDALVLAVAGELGACDADGALEQLDSLGAEIAEAAAGDEDPQSELDAVVGVLGRRHGFIGNRQSYDDPDNSMLDLVIARRTGLPILLSIVYVETARRAGIDLGGVGLPGHYVAGHFGGREPLLVDPFAGGMRLEIPGSAAFVRSGTHQTVLRVLNNLVGSYRRRNDLSRAIRAAELRMTLPLGEAQAAALELELKSIRSALN